MTVPQIEYALGEAFGMRSVSPFCLKLEMILANLGLDYTLIVEADPRSAPKGKCLGQRSMERCSLILK